MHCKHKQTVNNTSKTNAWQRQQVQVQVEVEVDKKSSISRLISQARRDWRNGLDDTYTSGPAGWPQKERTYIRIPCPAPFCLFILLLLFQLFILFVRDFRNDTEPEPEPELEPEPNCRLTKIMRIQFARRKEK